MDILILEDISCTGDLLPFTATRSVLDIRMGILTFREKWARLLGPDGFRLTTGTAGPALPANLLPTRALAARIREEFARGPLNQASIDRILTHGRLIRYPWHIFQHNGEALIEDFDILTAGRLSQPLAPGVQTVNPENIFVEAGARLNPCIVLNASTGPIYIGRDAEIMEGSLIRGPFAAGEGAVVKMGAKIYGATTLGPASTAGGEIKNVVFFGYSNKGHDGYLGDAVIGEWCNLGAGVSASNLKNNAGEVRVFHPASRTWLNAGGKCGLLMGDYSRAAINTSFDTGTLVGVCCNIFGAADPSKYVPDFTWGTADPCKYEWEKALRDIDNWKKLKNRALSPQEILALKHIFAAL
jgi:UDP-N-acetylglucosamine diphosphorylase / glucose-1-phosphate thymidylyltransferase / UDP-N-acetylgalactosamine diphosphorylase / glucosamine-1-phosphate N-acetyltransferase / galactosamine-1-phosphate N-acetyltransferase